MPRIWRSPEWRRKPTGVSLSSAAKLSRKAGPPQWANSDIASISKDGNRIQDALKQWSNNRSWSKNRDTFQQSIISASQSNTSSTASGISSSLTQAQSLSREARQLYETADRLEQRWSAQDGRGVSGALNTSDAFLSFARSEIANTPLVFRAFDPANATHWSSNDREIASERGLLIGRYTDQIGREIRAEVSARLVSPDSEGIAAPSSIMSGGLGVRGVAVGSGAARSRGRASPETTLRQEGTAIRQEVDVRQSGGRGVVEQKTHDALAETPASSALSKQGAERARLWGKLDR